MNITEHEIRGLLAGKCLPGDMRVNEELPAYLVRKFAEIKAQRDALAADNAAMKSAIKYVCSTDNFPDYHPDGMGCGIEDRGIFDRYEAARYGWDEAMERIYSELIQPASYIKTPATSAYLNSVRAEGVDMVAESLMENGVCTSSHTVSYFKQFAAQLRAGKDGE
ncbi:hypothetical protein ACLHDD_02020 [Pantoea sp. NSTU24]|uniref:hypothetical protein n=1 Tax=Pantoea sp. NSTU24 TaxID=3391144 RepID=UPI003D043188